MTNVDVHREAWATLGWKMLMATLSCHHLPQCLALHKRRQMCKLKSTNYTYFYPPASKVNLQPAICRSPPRHLSPYTWTCLCVGQRVLTTHSFTRRKEASKQMKPIDDLHQVAIAICLPTHYNPSPTHKRKRMKDEEPWPLLQVMYLPLLLWRSQVT